MGMESTINVALPNPVLLAADQSWTVVVLSSNMVAFDLGDLPVGDGYSIAVTAVDRAQPIDLQRRILALRHLSGSRHRHLHFPCVRPRTVIHPTRNRWDEAAGESPARFVIALIWSSLAREHSRPSRGATTRSTARTSAC
jgi:hypothetical protein